MASVPVISGSQSAELSTIPGRPPRPDEQLAGCAFAPRCPLVIDRCRAEQPELETIEAGGKVACFVVADSVSGGSIQ